MKKIKKLEQIVEVEFLQEIERNRDKINEIIDVLNSWVFEPTLTIPSQSQKQPEKCDCDYCKAYRFSMEKEPEEKLREITTSERVGFLYAVGNDDLLIEELDKFIQQELDKAREEGRREGSEITSRYISDFVKSESGKSGRKEILEYIEELSKLKDNK